MNLCYTSLIPSPWSSIRGLPLDNPFKLRGDRSDHGFSNLAFAFAARRTRWQSAGTPSVSTRTCYRRMRGRGCIHLRLANVHVPVASYLSVSLRFALSIEYWWPDADRYPDWQERAQRHVVQEVRKRIEDQPNGWLVEVLDPTWPWILDHLIRHSYKSSVFGPQDWAWILPALRDLVKDDRFIPQVAYLLSDRITKFEIDESGDRERVQTFVLDRNYLRELIPDKQQQTAILASLIKANDFPQLDAESQISLRNLQQDIEKYLGGG